MKKIFIGAVLVLVVVGVIWFLPKKTVVPAVTPVTEETTSASPTAPSTPTSTTAPSASAYKDGTYSAVGSYNSPGGSDDLNVSVTLADGIITDATVTSGAHDQTSSHYQGVFIANYKPLVIGKNIDDVVLSKVSGSSLTSGGFNQALTKIKAQATA